MITKRHLGITLLAAGLLAIVGVLLVDLLGAGEFSGIGPAQRWALAGAAVVALLGAGLIPLGDRPA
jgi:Zn-dependent protease with chaperone function